MQFVYALINFSILFGIIFLFGRRAIASIFVSRRERIDKALDEAEKIEKTVVSVPQIPTVEELCGEIERDNEVAEIEQAAAIEVSEHMRQTDEVIAGMRREAVNNTKDDFIKKLTDRVTELVSSEPYVSELRRHENEFADRILEQIRLTPGDMAYLKSSDVLYVTLTSAHELAPDLVERIGRTTESWLTRVNGKQSFWVKVDPTLLGGLRLRIGDTVYDCTVADNIYHLTKTLQKRMVSGNETVEELTDDLMQAIREMDVYVSEFQLGRVISISDGICWLDGLADIMYGEVIEFECGERGMVLDIEPTRIGCIVYGKYENIESGSRVRRVGRIAAVPVGEELLGRVVDPLGHPIDGLGRIWTDKHRPIECRAPGIPDRSSVSRPMHTGIKAIDALVPIGRGQRELIIGDRQTGKTSVAVDAIINQKGKDVVCIYVAIGQKDASVAEIREKLTRYGAMDYTTIVCAPASSSASLQYIAPFAGAAMGEYFMYSGRDVLIVYDDLSKHAVAYRAMSLLIRRPPGREAYPGDVFYLHSRLLERAARVAPEYGGGSITALPIIETQAGDVSAYIPTNVISITDGQIFLESELFHSGVLPAVNPGISVSRVGGKAQIKAMKKVSGQLKLLYSQYRELQTFAQFGSDLDADTKARLAQGERIVEVLKQDRSAPIRVELQVAMIYAVVNNYLREIEVSDVKEYERELYEFLPNRYEELMRRIAETGLLTEEDNALLDTALTEFTESFRERYREVES